MACRQFGAKPSIILTNNDLLLIWILGTKFGERSIIKGYVFENVVCEIGAILSRSQCDKGNVNVFVTLKPRYPTPLVVPSYMYQTL